MTTSTGGRGGRPTIACTHGVVASRHYLAAEAGLHVLRSGGNAMDAAAATAFALCVLEPHQNGFGGEAPTLIYNAAEGRVYSVSGHGTAPAAATIERFRELGVDEVIPGDGFLGAVVPPAPATWIAILKRFGTMRLADVMSPALDLAEKGFPMGQSLSGTLRDHAKRFREEWPSSAKALLCDGDAPQPGKVWRQPELAATFRKLIEAEASCRGRQAGLDAAHKRFYKGDIAESIVDFAANTPVRDASGRAHACLLTRDDLAGFAARFEDPVTLTYKGIDVHKCGPWTQGPVMLQSLGLLAGFDLQGMGHNSADYVHTVTECMKLAYADREFHYGDPAFVDVPFERLLSERYAGERRGLVDPAHASLELRPGGYDAVRAEKAHDVALAVAAGGAWTDPQGDTTKLDIVDGDGNMVSPSGGWLMSSPVVPGLGFPLGTRGQMFSLVPEHPNSLQPGKRPRTTLTPCLTMREGRPYIAFGSPGGDCQDQWGLQFFLNVVEFGMSLQEAAEAPTFFTKHFPNSFYPRKAEPGSLCVEGRIPEDVRAELTARGHLVSVVGDWSSQNLCCVRSEEGVLSGAVSPRGETAYAAGW
jgi:gamma-glutamyltranspeptidase/glutathione hydrolase